MRTQFNRKLIVNCLALLTCAAIWWAGIQPAGATYLGQVIIQDTFTAATGSNAGRSPAPINLPGNTYGGGSVSANQLNLTDQSAAISIASGNGYTKPTVFQLAIDLNFNGMAQPTGGLNPSAADRPRGLTLGFFNNTTQGNPDRRQIDGIIWSPDGRLIAVTNSTSGVKAVAQSIGSFNTNGFHNLAFWVDTTSGSLFEVTFDGAPVTFNAAIPNVFTSANTMFPGVYGVNGNDSVAATGIADNFTITAALPEPSTVILFGLGGAIMWRRRGKRME